MKVENWVPIIYAPWVEPALQKMSEWFWYHLVALTELDSANCGYFQSTLESRKLRFYWIIGWNVIKWLNGLSWEWVLCSARLGSEFTKNKGFFPLMLTKTLDFTARWLFVTRECCCQRCKSQVCWWYQASDYLEQSTIIVALGNVVVLCSLSVLTNVMVPQCHRFLTKLSSWLLDNINITHR